MFKIWKTQITSFCLLLNKSDGKLSNFLLCLDYNPSLSKFQEESINKLGSDEIISIVLQLFKFLGIDITPFKIIAQSQKYRVANKIRDELKVSKLSEALRLKLIENIKHPSRLYDLQ